MSSSLSRALSPNSSGRCNGENGGVKLDHSAAV